MCRLECGYEQIPSEVVFFKICRQPNSLILLALCQKKKNWRMKAFLLVSKSNNFVFNQHQSIILLIK